MRRIFICTICLLALGLSTLAQDTLRVMTFNLHFGKDATLARISAVIDSVKPHFVALEEVDINTHRASAAHQNGKNFINELAFRTGLFGQFGKTINFSGGHYGIGILSRYPFISTKMNMLPNPDPKKEQRGLLETLVALPSGDTLMFACTHLEAFSKVCREAQGQWFKSHLAKLRYPTIIGGDFNCTPDDPVITQVFDKLMSNASGHAVTFSTTKPEQKIDYIFTDRGTTLSGRHTWKVIETHTVPVKVSDHFPVVATLVLSK